MIIEKVFFNKRGYLSKRFKVIQENNIVVGEGVQTSVFDELSNYCTEAELDCMPCNIVFDAVGIDDTMKFNHAKTKCDPRDVWDEKTGIDVCSAKLDYKEHMRKVRKLERLLVIMNSAMRKIEDLCQKHQLKAKAIRKDLEDYYGGIY